MTLYSNYISSIVTRFNLDFLYTTITMGVDPGYVKENFYDKVCSHLLLHTLYTFIYFYLLLSTFIYF